MNSSSEKLEPPKFVASAFEFQCEAKFWRRRAIDWLILAGLVQALYGGVGVLVASRSNTIDAKMPALFLLMPGALYVALAFMLGFGHRWAWWIGISTSIGQLLAATMLLLAALSDPISEAAIMFFVLSPWLILPLSRAAYCLWRCRRVDWTMNTGARGFAVEVREPDRHELG